MDQVRDLAMVPGPLGLGIGALLHGHVLASLLLMLVGGRSLLERW